MRCIIVSDASRLLSFRCAMSAILCVGIIKLDFYSRVRRLRVSTLHQSFIRSWFSFRFSGNRRNERNRRRVSVILRTRKVKHDRIPFVIFGDTARTLIRANSDNS